MNRLSSRRSFLAGTGVAIGALTAGCSSGPDPKFQLKTHRVEDLAHGPDIGEYVIDPLESKSKYSVDLSDEYKQAKVEELVDTGSVSTRAWELSYRNQWGPTWRDRRQCFEFDDTYYRIRVESRAEVTRERWVFYLDWDDQNPDDDDAAVISLPDHSLSEQDQLIVETARADIPHEDRRDVGHDRPRNMTAVVFHEELDAEESDLAPDPPFHYLEHDDEYFRTVTERGAIERPEQRFTAEPVGESFDEYREYAEENYPDSRFSNVDLSEEATEILDTAIGIDEGFAYEEEPPLSEALEEVLDHLTITEYLEPHDTYEHSTWFRDALAEYRNRWYEFTLVIYPEDHESH